MKELEAIQELVRRWHKRQKSSPSLAYSDCADELEALLPALEKAFIDLESEVSRYRGNYRGAQTEIAALKEPMSCTHPKACWQATKPDSVDAVVGYRCVACEHERLAVAAALRKAAKIADSPQDACPLPNFKIAAKILAMISDSDRSALDAHDAELITSLKPAMDARMAEVRDRALEEAFDKHRYREHNKATMMGGYCTCGMFGQTRGQSHDSWALHVIDAMKRGSK